MPRDKLIQPRRGTASEWSAVNPVLAEAELGYETDTKKIKVGDGTTAWASLGYITTWGSGGSGGGAVDSVNGQTGAVVLSKSNIGLSNVDNTSDANKPVSTATKTALDLKATVNSPTFTGTVTLPAGQSVNGVTLTVAGSASNYLRANGTYGSIGSNIDGGSAASVYGGATIINGGGA